MLKEQLPLADIELLKIDAGISLAEAISKLERQDGVLYAEPNFYRYAARMPNDPYFGYQWGLHNGGQSFEGVTGALDADIDATEGWDVSTSASAANVAVIDSGIDLNHRDLAGNIWSNPGETGGGREFNRRDDDINGFVDDYRGWDWIGSDNQPEDGHGHGTHVAGTIGARGDDGFGVAGVAWNARLMPLRILDNQGAGTLGSALLAYTYAGTKGASVVNASFGGSEYSRSESDVLRALPNVLFVVAAGNTATDNDRLPDYPCAYDLGNVVCVAASDQHDGLAGFSNYGPTSVDLAAPGENIISTWPGGNHAVLDGTSMAAPHVAAAAALLFTRNPTLSPTAVRDLILRSVDRKPGLATLVGTGGRLNTARALGIEPPPPATPQTQGGTASAPDSTGPRVFLRLRRHVRLRHALRRGIRAYVRCSEPCRLKFRLLAVKRSGRRPGRLRRVRGQRLVARRFTSAGSKTRTVVLRFSAAAARRLARASRVRFVVAVTAEDRVGNVSRRQRALTLRG